MGYLRPEVKYSSLETLIAQIQLDVDQSRSVMDKLKGASPSLWKMYAESVYQSVAPRSHNPADQEEELELEIASADEGDDHWEIVDNELKAAFHKIRTKSA